MAMGSEPVFDVGINETLPLPQLGLLGLQNIFGMTGMFVFPGILGRAFDLPVGQIAYLYGMSFIVCGIITTLQSVVLLRLPIVQGPYAGNFAALLAAGHLPGAGGLGAAYGSFFVAALIWCALSVPVRGVSVVGLFARYLRAPLIVGMLIMLTMIQVSNVALPNWIGTQATPGFPLVSFGAGLVAVIVLVAVTLWGGRLRRAAVLFALIAGTAGFAFYRPIAMTPVLQAPLLVTPAYFPFGFAVRADFVAVFLLTLIPAGMASMALYQMMADWGGERLSPGRMSEGIFAVALGSVIAGITGGFTTIAYPDNIGLLRSTRVASRYATLAAGVLLIILGGCVKFDMLLVLVPLPVLSAAATVLFGIVFMHAIQILARVDWNEGNLIAAGLAVLVGLGGLFVAPDTLDRMPLLLRLVLAQPIISGGIIVVVLHALLGRAAQAA